jgi:glycosyltransferase involved in cell wall biosynthesis
MKIMHYTLGLPPMRSGGLTKYAQDLMIEQSKQNKIIHLYPGKVDFVNKKTRVMKEKADILNTGITHYEVINSLPLPLFRGIKQPEDFMTEVPLDIYRNFLSKVKPNIIHIHTLMGLHKEFIIAGKSLGIKLIYTTHDYFGICPTINLYKDRENINCNTFKNGQGCQECCFNAMGTQSLLLSQTPFYPFIKNLKNFLPLKTTERVLKKVPKKDIRQLEEKKAIKYVFLREYYFEMLRKIDLFHFNSTLAEDVYKMYLPEIKGKVISITHSGIKKVNVKKKVEATKFRLGYLGPMKEYKGFSFLLEAFHELPKDKFELHLYGDNSKVNLEDNIFLHGRYSSNDLENIFSSLDLVVVPSTWRETFGFVTLEALSFGTPLMVSATVGSKDLVQEDFGWIFNTDTTNELVHLFNHITKDILYQKHRNIEKNFKNMSLEKHADLIKEYIYK